MGTSAWSAGFVLTAGPTNEAAKACGYRGTMETGWIATDERRHEPGRDERWTETWHLDFAANDGSLAGYITLQLRPHTGSCWYWACLTGAGRPLVTVLEFEAPLPPAPGLELRSSGLWAEVIPQVPFDHMTVGLEAFGVAMDDPSEVYRSGWGDRTPLGFDLEWETVEGALAAAPGDSAPQDGGLYEIGCSVHGEILVADEVIDLDGFGSRWHRWGAHQHWSSGASRVAGRLGDDRWFALAEGPRDAEERNEPNFWGFRGAELTKGGGIDARIGDHGFPVSALVTLDDIVLEVTPIAMAPVQLPALPSESGVKRGHFGSRLARAFCAVRTRDDAQSGYCWLESRQTD